MQLSGDHCPKWGLSGGDCLGSNCSWWQLSRGKCPGGNCLGAIVLGEIVRGGIVLFSFSTVHKILWKNVSTLRHFLKKYFLFNLNIIGPKSDKSASEFLKLCFHLC